VPPESLETPAEQLPDGSILWIVDLTAFTDLNDWIFKLQTAPCKQSPT
jgi:hypothetical protein